MRALIEEAQPQIVGGCCGTNPEHKHLRKVLDTLPVDLRPQTKQQPGAVLIAGRGQAVGGKANGMIIIPSDQPYDRQTLRLNGRTI